MAALSTGTTRELAEPLAAVRHRQGRLIGHMEALGFNLRQEAVLQTLTADVLKSSEIEGENLDAEQVRSSIARRLGIDIGALKPADRHVEGVVEMMLDATQHYDQPLTAERLFAWHAALFPTGRSGMRRINVGAWRDDSTGPMQVVSGPIGKERVHFEAPAAARLDNEMSAFLDWFKRALTDRSVSEGRRSRISGLSPSTRSTMATAASRAPSPTWRSRARRTARSASTACRRRSGRSATPITTSWKRRRRERWTSPRGWNGSWAAWVALSTARRSRSAPSWPRRASGNASQASPFNDRQRLVLNRLLDGFEGKLTTSKYAKLAKCSQDTALRDILPLVERGILVRNPEGGRSTSYTLAT